MAVQFTFQKNGVCGCTCGPIPKRWPRGWRAKKFIPLPSANLGPSKACQFCQLIGHFKATLRNFHVPFDADRGFQFMDVHDEAEALSFAATTRICGATKFVSGADAAVVPCGDLLWPEQIRMLFSWKHPGELQCYSKRNYSSCDVSYTRTILPCWCALMALTLYCFALGKKAFITGRASTDARQATLHSMMQCAYWHTICCMFAAGNLCCVTVMLMRRMQT